eukprot:TRINITY_DN2181_c0_g1_i19.p1 TRINITY_DN2181_c0_g1~~TRINITY_DN2181_c0_g1_i19.p1  ORF type:complete len:467 (-),score=129.07 TRINITY_DN2181_c0_g1_i19:337-1737(-)
MFETRQMHTTLSTEVASLTKSFIEEWKEEKLANLHLSPVLFELLNYRISGLLNYRQLKVLTPAFQERIHWSAGSCVPGRKAFYFGANPIHLFFSNVCARMKRCFKSKELMHNPIFFFKMEDQKEAPEKYDIEALLDARKTKFGFVYLVKWKGYSADENSWEPETTLMEDAPLVVDDFWDKRGDEKQRKRLRTKYKESLGGVKMQEAKKLIESMKRERVEHKTSKEESTNRREKKVVMPKDEKSKRAKDPSNVARIDGEKYPPFSALKVLGTDSRKRAPAVRKDSGRKEKHKKKGTSLSMMTKKNVLEQSGALSIPDRLDEKVQMRKTGNEMKKKKGSDMAKHVPDSTKEKPGIENVEEKHIDKRRKLSSMGKDGTETSLQHRGQHPPVKDSTRSDGEDEMDKHSRSVDTACVKITGNRRQGGVWTYCVEESHHHHELGTEGKWLPSNLIDPDLLIDYMEDGLRKLY